MKKWGRRKIIYELKARGITPGCIQDALNEISEEEYLRTLRELAEKKAAGLPPENDPFVIKKKITAYLLMKGYEPTYIDDTLNRLD